jgi:hypothetical protein
MSGGNLDALLIAERAIGEIFGWDRVDWSLVRRQRGRRFAFDRDQQMTPAVHEALLPLFDRCRPAEGSFAPLRPSPVVNRALGRMITLVCRHFGAHHLPAAAGPQCDGARERLHHDVVDHILARIGGDSRLEQRAAMLKRIAAAAEGELERHYAERINARIEAALFPKGHPDRGRLDRLKSLAAAQIAETPELPERAATDAAAAPERRLRVEMAKILLQPFPYLDNYAHMMAAESAMLNCAAPPRFVRERRLGDSGGRIDAAALERFDRAIAGLAGDDSGERPLPGRMAFCGSGPLPLSALLLHLSTGIEMLLIERDREAVRASTRLLQKLEALDIIAPGGLELVERDAGDCRFVGRRRPASADAFCCDAVMIASLVDPRAKARIADGIAAEPAAPDLLLVRSARGLAAALAYDPIDSERLGGLALAYCGEALPRTQIATHLDRVGAIREGRTSPASRDLLAIAHPDVVNSTELYRRYAARRLPGAPPGNATPTDWIDLLEQAQAVTRQPA